MTTEIPEITEERIREFACAGGMDPDQVDTFLDSKCYLMVLTIPAIAAMELVKDHKLTKRTAVVSCVDAGQGNISFSVWVPEPHAKWLMDEVQAAYKEAMGENVMEFQDLDKMSKAMPGREYIRSMLIGAAQAGMEI